MLLFVTDPVCGFHGQELGCSRGEEGVRFGNLRVTALLFAGDVIVVFFKP